MDYIKTSTHTVSLTEVGANNKLKPTVLLDCLQNIAADHAARIGFGIEHLAAKGFTWFTARIHIKVNRYPYCNERVTMRSWPSGDKKLFAFRDFEILDDNQEVLIAASSAWFVIDIEKRRPRRPQQALGQLPKVDARAIETNFDPLPELEKADTEKTFEPLFSQIDTNDHINTTAYLMWAIETMPKEILQTKQLTEIEIAYKNETLYGQHVTAKTQLINNGDELTAIHQITNNETNTEAARLRTRWQ
jgi:medium-chain acyl-[acyl-carrier-protein] hydrolase